MAADARLGDAGCNSITCRFQNCGSAPNAHRRYKEKLFRRTEERVPRRKGKDIPCVTESNCQSTRKVSWLMHPYRDLVAAAGPSAIAQMAYKNDAIF